MTALPAFACMPTRLVVISGLLTVTACFVDLAVGSDVAIGCETDAQCPPDWICDLLTARCVEVTGNRPPVVLIGEIVPAGGGRYVDDVIIPVSISDTEGDPVDLSIEFSTDYDAVSESGSWHTATVASASPLAGLNTDRAGRSYSLIWDAVADAQTGRGGLSVAQGDDAGDVVAPFVRTQHDVVVRVTATDGSTGGQANVTAVSTPFVLGNRAPRIACVVLFDERTPTPTRVSVCDGTADPPGAPKLSGNVPVELLVIDDDGDPVDIELEVAAPTSSFLPATLALGATDRVDATPAPGTAAVLVWDSTAPSTQGGIGPRNVIGVQLRARASDYPQPALAHAGRWMAPAVVDVSNQTPPRVDGVYVKSDGGLHSGAVPIRYRLTDDASDVVDIRVEFSTDEVAWYPATEYTSPLSEGTYDLRTSSQGVEHTFIWDAAFDIYAYQTSSWLRITAADDQNVGAPAVILFGAQAGPASGSTRPWTTRVVADNCDVVGGTGGCGGAPLCASLGATAADFDGDGWADLAVANFYADGTCSGSLRVFASQDAGDGKRVFEPSVDVPGAPPNPMRVRAGDITGDGDLDLVVTSLPSGLHIFEGNGAGGFAALPVKATAQHPRELALGNIDDVSPLDALVGGWEDHSVVVHLGPNDAGPAISLPGKPQGLVVAELNGDDYLDFAVAWNDCGCCPDKVDRSICDAGTTVSACERAPWTDCEIDRTDGVSIYAGGGDGTFALDTVIEGCVGPQALASADVDRDGWDDLVVPCRQDGTILFYSGQTGATEVFPCTRLPEYVRITDLDGDGWLDVVVVNPGVPGLDLFLNSAGEVPERLVFLNNVGLPSDPQEALAGDFDGDGATDLVAVSWKDGTTNTLTSLGKEFHSERLSPGRRLEATSDAFEVLVADVDADGLPDVVGGAGSGVALFSAEGADGVGFSFAPLRSAVAPLWVHGIGAGDVNGDGLRDLVVADGGTVSSGTVSMSLGQGSAGIPDGTFGPVTDVDVGRWCVWAEIHDLGGDGYGDVLAIRNGFGAPSLNNLLIWSGDASGGLTGPSEVTIGYEGSFAGSVADFDADGDLDMAVTVWTTGGATGAVQILDNDGFGNLAPGSTIDAGLGVREIAAADLDRDGDLDLAVTEWEDDRVSVLVGDGNGGFSVFPSRSAYAAPAGPNDLIIVDLNDDGRLDLAVLSNDASDTLTVFEQLPGGSDTPRFTVRDSIYIGGDPQYLTSGDLNADATPDLVIGRKGFRDFLLKSGRRGALAPPWPRSLDDVGFGLSASGVDRFGGARRHGVSLRRFDRWVDGARFTPENPNAFGQDFGEALWRASLLPMESVSPDPNAVPVTEAMMFCGSTRLARDVDGGALRVERRLALDLSSPTVGNQTGILVDLPLLPDRVIDDPATVRVFARFEDFRRDASAPQYLPRTGGADVMLHERTWEEIPLDADGDLHVGNQVGPRFVATGLGIRVLTDRDGAFQAFERK